MPATPRPEPSPVPSSAHAPASSPELSSAHAPASSPEPSPELVGDSRRHPSGRAAWARDTLLGAGPAALRRELAPVARATLLVGLPVLTLVAVRLHASTGLVVALAATAAAVPLALVDAREHRLPHDLLRPATLAVLLLTVLTAVVVADAASLVRAVAGASTSTVVHAVLARTGGLGGGDVRLAALLGLPLAWHGWSVLLAGVLGAFVLGGVWALGLLVLRRTSRRSSVAFGPWMVVGSVLALTGA